MFLRSGAILVAFVLAAGLCPSSGAAEPRAVLGPTEHDFGSVRQGEKVVWLFRLRNDGDTPLELKGIQFSRSGMSGRLPATVAPGGEAIISLEWTTERVQGRVRGVAVVETNDPRARAVPLMLAGTVLGLVEIEPVPAVFLSAFRGEDVRRDLTIRSNQPGPITMRLDSPRGAHYVADLEAVEPGRSWRLIVRPAPATPPGRYTETLELQSGDPAIGKLRLPVHVFVKADLYANPEEIDFGSIHLSGLAQAPSGLPFLTQTFLVKTRRGEFEITSIDADVPALEITRSPAGSSGTFRIDVGLAPDRLKAGPIRGSIRIVTTDRDFPELIVPVRGAVR